MEQIIFTCLFCTKEGTAMLEITFIGNFPSEECYRHKES